MATHTGASVALESVLRILIDHRRCRTSCLATRHAIRATILRIRKIRGAP